MLLIPPLSQAAALFFSTHEFTIYLLEYEHIIKKFNYQVCFILYLQNLQNKLNVTAVLLSDAQSRLIWQNSFIYSSICFFPGKCPKILLY